MILCIVGPTGVGKTKLSIKLAKHYKAIIINCDAMQIYQEMVIGTAKVKEKEKEGISHYLLDFVPLDKEYTVYDYQKAGRKLLEEFKDKNIILVGGTGLYLKALLYDYIFPEETDQKNYENYSNEELYQKALEKDKNILIHPHNRQRLLRFLNKKIINQSSAQLLYKVNFIGLTTEREKLYQLINQRVDKMLAEGLLKEVEKLYKKYPTSKALHKAIGYKELIAYLEAKSSLEEAVQNIKQNSRHYAKRQYTWFNNQFDIKWFEVNFDDFEQTFRQIKKYLAKQID